MIAIRPNLGQGPIAALRRGDGCDHQNVGRHVTTAAGCSGRIFIVAVVATSGAADNVMMYSSLLIGRSSGDVFLAAFIFVVLTGLLCVAAFMTARSCLSMVALQKVAARVTPFTTTAIGLTLLIRFDTLGWIYSLA